MTPFESDSDPGPLYKGIGVLLFLAAIGFLFLLVVLGRAIGWVEVTLFALLLVAALILWRPKWMGGLVETIADKLPFVRFTKAPPTDGVG